MSRSRRRSLVSLLGALLGAVGLPAALRPVLSPGADAAGAAAATAPAAAVTAGVPATLLPAAADTIRFQHEKHASLDCGECHATGQATVATQQKWCADCHHVTARPGECGRCHATTQVRRASNPVLYTFRFSVGESRTRRLTFRHSEHAELACGECHTGRAPAEVSRSCGSCHEPHHRLEADCLACHAKPPAGAHREEVHRVGCGGSDCHAVKGLEVAGMVASRNTCLSCHTEQREHEPGGVCAACHILGTGKPAPAARGRR